MNNVVQIPWEKIHRAPGKKKKKEKTTRKAERYMDKELS